MLHLAWEGLPNYKEPFHLTQNLPRHFNFINNLLEHGLKDITITGTCFEYGMKEGCLVETMHCEPANPYATAKNELRKKIEILAQKAAASFKWVRLFYMYGQGQSPKSLFSQLDAALKRNDEVFNMSGGEQERDFLPVDKVVEYLVNIALQNEVEGIINCCSGRGVKVKDLVADYIAGQHKKIHLNLGFYPYTDYEAMCFWGDDSKLKAALNYLKTKD
jgi:dTDP-6-deoxy-L-talose 4-dehydrogenase (NAD+)